MPIRLRWRVPLAGGALLFRFEELLIKVLVFVVGQINQQGGLTRWQELKKAVKRLLPPIKLSMARISIRASVRQAAKKATLVDFTPTVNWPESPALKADESADAPKKPRKATF